MHNIDGVILFGVLVVVLTCAVVVYLGYYSWRHFKQDELSSARDSALKGASSSTNKLSDS